MSLVPHLSTVMTPFPYCIEEAATLEEARSMMDSHQIRHLPVKREDALVGVLSDRDIRCAMDPRIGPPSLHAIHVEHVMVPDPYVVDIDERLTRVLATMAARHIGCSLVTKGSRLVGIFTTTDACRAFAEHLWSLGAPHGDDAA